jgi:hypothetical protein
VTSWCRSWPRPATGLDRDPKNPPLIAKLIAKRVMNFKYRQYLAKLRNYTDLRFGVST